MFPPDVLPEVLSPPEVLPEVFPPDVLPEVLPDVVEGPAPWTSAQIAHTSSVHLPKGSPDAFAAQPEPSASGADVRNNAVATLVPAPPPITCLPLGQFAVTDFVAPLDDELTTRTVSTERT